MSTDKTDDHVFNPKQAARALAVRVARDVLSSQTGLFARSGVSNFDNLIKLADYIVGDVEKDFPMIPIGRVRRVHGVSGLLSALAEEVPDCENEDCPIHGPKREAEGGVIGIVEFLESIADGTFPAPNVEDVVDREPPTDEVKVDEKADPIAKREYCGDEHEVGEGTTSCLMEPGHYPETLHTDGHGSWSYPFNEELPGMWEKSDFSGGATDTDPGNNPFVSPEQVNEARGLDPEPQPGDGPEYAANHAAWERRNGRGSSDIAQWSTKRAVSDNPLPIGNWKTDDEKPEDN